MLPTEHRLTKLRDFNLIMKHGRWLKSDYFTIKVLELAKNKDFFPKKEDQNSFEKQLRIAVSTGLKLSKSAVDRNRVRRQVGEVVRLLLAKKSIRGGLYMLIVPEKKVIGTDYAKISEEITLLLAKAKVLV